MKILMIGLGSIGQRHLRNLKDHFGDSVEFLAYRVRGLQRTFSDTMQIRENVELDREFSLRVFTSLESALEEKPQIAYITNVTSQHLSCAFQALQAGCDVFIEKPISYDLEGVAALVKLAKKKKRIVCVGFQNRFHPALNRLKELIHQREFGAIISVQAEVGERLTTMHSYENYAETYMAKRNLGGGVIVNQQIHEFDYLQWIFGEPVSVMARCGKNSSLQLDVEDYCDALFYIEAEHGSFPIYCHADFFQFPPRRYCKVIFEHGWICADLLSASLTICVEGQPLVTEEFPEFTRNQMFVDQMLEFLQCVHTRNQRQLTLEDGVVSLRMVVAAKKSSMENRSVLLEEVSI